MRGTHHRRGVAYNVSSEFNACQFPSLEIRNTVRRNADNEMTEDIRGWQVRPRFGRWERWCCASFRVQNLAVIHVQDLRQETNPGTADQSTENHDIESCRRRLDCTANNKNRRAKEKGLAATEGIPKSPGQN
jgi:hypothetical protein